MPVVVCEKHRLRYDSDRQPGCVLCLREAGVRPAAAGQAKSPPESPRRQGILLPLLVAVGIWMLSALGLTTTHRALLDLVAAGTATEQAARTAAATAEKQRAAQRELESLQVQEPAPESGAYEPVADGAVGDAPAEPAEPAVEASPAEPADDSSPAAPEGSPPSGLQP